MYTMYTFFMRSKVAKFFQAIGGLFGILIAILAVGYMDGYLSAFLDILVDSPTVSGLLTGIPLIPLIHSAKQKFILVQYDEISSADYESNTYYNSQSYEVPVAGWLNEIRTTVFQETQPSVDVGLIVTWTGDFEKQVWEQGSTTSVLPAEVMSRWQVADSIAEFQTSYPMHLFYIDDAVDSNDAGQMQQITKIGGPGKFFEQGQLAINTIVMDEMYGNNDATGVTNIVTEAIFIVAAFDGKGGADKDEICPYVTIVGETTSSARSGFHWLANTNMRIVNLRATVWQGLDVANASAHLVIAKNAPDLTLSANAIEMHSAHTIVRIMHPIQDATGAGTTFAPIVTAYARGPHYFKKGETMQVAHESINSSLTITFQYIPDFGYLAEFNRRFESTSYSSDYTSQWVPLWTAPYDMFVTAVKGTVAIITDNNESDAVYSMQLMGLKMRNMLDSNDFLLTYVAANVRGNILGAQNDAGQTPFSLGTVTMVVEAVDSSTGAETVTNTTTAARTSYAEAVADYYPAGSAIGFFLPDDMSTNISTFIIEMHVEGLNRVKTRNAGTNVLQSPMVVQAAQ